MTIKLTFSPERAEWKITREMKNCNFFDIRKNISPAFHSKVQIYGTYDLKGGLSQKCGQIQRVNHGRQWVKRGSSKVEMQSSPSGATEGDEPSFSCPVTMRPCNTEAHCGSAPQPSPLPPQRCLPLMPGSLQVLGFSCLLHSFLKVKGSFTNLQLNIVSGHKPNVQRIL